MRNHDLHSSERRNLPSAFVFHRRVVVAITVAAIYLASGSLIAQSPSQPATPSVVEPSSEDSPQTEVTSDKIAMKEPTPSPTPEKAEATDTRSLPVHFLVLSVLVIVFAFLIVSRQRKNLGGQLSGPSPQSDRVPAPDANFDRLIAVYRSNGEVLPPKDQVDLQKRLGDLVYGVHAYAVCSHSEVAQLLGPIEDFDPAKAFYYLVEYRCPGGIISEDMKSGAMRATETRRSLSLEGTTVEQVRYFHYLPETAGLQAFK